MATDLPGTIEDDDALIAVIVRRGESDRAMRAAHQAFQALYLRHGPLLRAFLSGRVARADADDLHQDVWRKVWAHLPDRYRPGNFRAWLHQVARALIIDQHRRQKPEAAIHEPEGLVVGERLGALVAESEGIYGPPARMVSLDQVLSDRRDAVLRAGLASPPHKWYGLFLSQPRLRLELQELVLISGVLCRGTLAAAQPEHRDSVARGRVRPSDESGRAPAAPRSFSLPPWGMRLAIIAAASLLLAAFQILSRPDGRPQPQSSPPSAASS
jgi:RNA polymerase sigma factor (sigma-70 family)